MTSAEALAARVRAVIDEAGFMTLATVGADGSPWASTLSCYAEGRRLMWESLRDTKHSQNLRREPRASGAIYRIDKIVERAQFVGAQFVGTVYEVGPDDAAQFHDLYYRLSSAGAAVHARPVLPLEQFVGDGPVRLYILWIERLWLIELDLSSGDVKWRRTEVDVTLL